jgi:hypothetical protein
MSSLTQNQLINEIVAKIISGGRLTTAQNVREVLNDILDSYPNVVDGGLVHQAVLGYSSLINLSSADPRSFVHKSYVDSVVGQVYTFSNGLTESGGTVVLGGNLTQDTTINGGNTRSLLLGNSVGNNNLRRFTVNASLSATINSPTVNLSQQTADSILTLDSANDIQGITLSALQSIRRNAGNTAFEAYTPSSGGSVVFRDSIPASHTGDLINTQIKSFLIPANTLTVGDMFEYYVTFFHPGFAAVATARFYVNTTNSLSGANLLGICTIASFVSYMAYGRTNNILSTTDTRVSNNTVGTIFTPQHAISGVGTTSLNVNWTVDQYFLISVQLGNASQTITYQSMYMTKR